MLAVKLSVHQRLKACLLIVVKIDTIIYHHHLHRDELLRLQTDVP